LNGSVITIGNFDGVHAGHRRIMKRVVEIAREHGWSPAVLTFDPHPTRVIAPSRAPKLMTSIEQRAALMRHDGIERIEILPFTPALAKLTPEEFVREVLCGRFHAKAVLVGANFRFGAKQAGDVRTLADLGKRYGFATEIVDEVRCRGRIVSSSSIRELIAAGNVALAARLLERPYAVEGEIVPGHGVGHKQTVPTLNLKTSAELLPANGVYITRTRVLPPISLADARGSEEQSWDSITNIGYRPTFGGHDLTIETFLLSPLEGQPPRRIRLDFLRRVREERKFDSPEALKAQILKDVARANAYFRRIRKWVRKSPVF
jgi:riboflavin kinase / FMN adenylyltransferase